MATFVGQVLYKRSTKYNIDDLVPAADAEHGHVLRRVRKEIVDVLVPHLGALGVKNGPVILLPIEGRVYIPPSWNEVAVQLVSIVSCPSLEG